MEVKCVERAPGEKGTISLRLCCTRGGSPRSRRTVSKSQRPGSWRKVLSPETEKRVPLAS
jgi:hypothetical protein